MSPTAAWELCLIQGWKMNRQQSPDVTQQQIPQSVKRDITANVTHLKSEELKHESVCGREREREGGGSTVNEKNTTSYFSAD